MITAEDMIPGASYAQGFLDRHKDDLCVAYANKRDATRSMWSTQENFRNWYNAVTPILIEAGLFTINPEYNDVDLDSDKYLNYVFPKEKPYLLPVLGELIRLIMFDEMSVKCDMTDENDHCKCELKVLPKGATNETIGGASSAKVTALLGVDGCG